MSSNDGNPPGEPENTKSDKEFAKQQIQPQVKQQKPEELAAGKISSDCSTLTSSTIADLPSTDLQPLLENVSDKLQPIENNDAYKWRENYKQQEKLPKVTLTTGIRV